MTQKIFPRKGSISPFVDWLGLTFSVINNGYSQCELEVNDRLMNSSGILHGGVVYSMADTAMGGALHSCMDRDERCATIELNIVYLAAVSSGRLICNTKVIHKDSGIAVMQSDVTNDGQLVAKALGTFAIMKSHKG